jgi:hypothetical protein
MPTSSNHTEVSVHCCNGNHTVASSQTLLSDLIGKCIFIYIVTVFKHAYFKWLAKAVVKQSTFFFMLHHFHIFNFTVPLTLFILRGTFKNEKSRFPCSKILHSFFGHMILDYTAIDRKISSYLK